MVSSGFASGAALVESYTVIRRRPESSELNNLDPGIRRGDGYFVHHLLTRLTFLEPHIARPQRAGFADDFRFRQVGGGDIATTTMR